MVNQTPNPLASQIRTWAIPVAVVTLLSCIGCYDPTTDKIDAGGAAAKKIEMVDVAENDARFALNGDNTDIKWTGSNSAGQSPHGFFYELSGEIVTEDVSGKLKHLEITIDMNSVKATNESLTEKLKHKGFFQVDEFPQSTFVMTSIKHEPRDGDPEGTNAVVQGNFQLRDVTQSITIPIEFTTTEKTKAGKVITTLRLKSEFKINRKDYGVVYSNTTEDVLIRDDILINLDIDVDK